MKIKITALIITVFVCNALSAHTINYEKVVLRHWSIPTEHRFVDGSFYMLKDGKVYIEDAFEKVISVPLESLSKADQDFAIQKNGWVNVLNNDNIAKKATTTSESQTVSRYKLWALAIVLVLLTLTVVVFADRKKLKYLVPVFFVGSSLIVVGFTKNNSLTTTDPAFVNSAFAPFAATVSTTYDATYFYVNSKGIPNHLMMVGISNHGWQQQVPIPQCYIGTNHWSIPLNPVIAATPVPVSATHFLKGAIAIAANGVAIFNYHTNTGVDSYLDGQLDNYGGHCGRADDYHYHTAPMHLITLGQTSATLPIAFALDGFAVYGSVEPNGSAMLTLDANHGHYGTNGVYHYHGTTTAPYMIGSMVGQVTEDSNLQIIPQAQSQPVRNENWTPLSGALITGCVANVNNGYNTAYTKNGTSGYATNYTATAAGLYTFQYVTPTGTTATNYNGPAQCTVPNLGSAYYIDIEKNITIYPNPATDVLHINLGNPFVEDDVQKISLYDLKGSLIYKIQKFTPSIGIKQLAKGSYFVKIQFSNSVVTKKLIVK